MPGPYLTGPSSKQVVLFLIPLHVSAPLKTREPYIRVAIRNFERPKNNRSYHVSC